MKPRKGLPKPKPAQRVRNGGAVGDSSMEDAEEWMQRGSGVSEDVRNVGAMPNEGVDLPDKLGGHLR